MSDKETPLTEAFFYILLALRKPNHGYGVIQEVEALTEMSGTLNRPMVQNRVVWNIYQEEADKYLEGSTDAEEAAENIAQKVDTYLAE